jgi:hypothetical protein
VFGRGGDDLLFGYDADTVLNGGAGTDTCSDEPRRVSCEKRF